MKVLIVDQSMEIIKRLEEVTLEAEVAMTIHKAVAYTAALQLFKQHRHNLVLLDIGLPSELSFKLLADIKAHTSNAHVIILSIHLDEAMKQECTLLGADFFYDKYNDFEKIPLLINTLALSKTS